MSREIGAHISSAMKIKNLNQKEAAALLGITAQYLNDIIQGRRSLSAVVAARLFVLGMPKGEGKDLFLRQAEREFDLAQMSWAEGIDEEIGN